MAADYGGCMLDDLLVLGFVIDLADDGKITATNATQTLHGKAQPGSIEWYDRAQVYAMTEQA